MVYKLLRLYKRVKKEGIFLFSRKTVVDWADDPKIEDGFLTHCVGRS